MRVSFLLHAIPAPGSVYSDSVGNSDEGALHKPPGDNCSVLLVIFLNVYQKDSKRSYIAKGYLKVWISLKYSDFQYL